VYDAISSKGEKDGPVEAKDNDEEEDGHNHLVHRFNGGHSSADRECSEQHSQTMTQHRPVAVLQFVECGVRNNIVFRQWVSTCDDKVVSTPAEQH